jgi:uncharacterized protein (TIGR03067 family)
MRAKALVLGVVLLVAADKADKPAAKDQDKIQGVWETTAVEFNGRNLTDDGVKLKLVFKGNTMSVDGDENIQKDYAKFTFKLDPSTSPKAIDMTVTEGNQKDTAIEGIYELKGDDLKMCFKVAGKDRPAKFESPEGEQIAYVVMKRHKD